MQPPAWMTSPSWFLVAGLPWPEEDANADMAEAAFAIAPYVTEAVRPVDADGKPIPLGRDLALMLDAGSRCAKALGRRALFLSDITLWLEGIGLTWARIGVDFATAQNELEQQSPSMLLTVSRKAYAIFCSASHNLAIYYSGTKAEVPPEKRELVRESLESALDADWPGYIKEALANAQSAA
jgi:hypothetical protein